MLGSWEIKVNTSGMPQKVASAFENLNEMVGAEYEFVAYIGSQVVNGTNHAVLAQQKLILGKDVTNVVMIIFHENKEGVSVSAIERIVEQGGELGGIQVDVQTTIPEEAKDAFDKVFEGYVGAKIEPFALLGSQVVRGINYIFAAEMTPVVKDPVPSFMLIVLNSLTGSLSFVNPLTNKTDSLSLGYAFTWLKNQNTSLGKPLGEWP